MDPERTMPPAPPLAMPGPPAAPEAASPASGSGAEPRRPGGGAPPAAAAASAVLLAHHRGLAEVHRAYLSHQARLHAGFVRLLEAVSAGLASGAVLPAADRLRPSPGAQREPQPSVAPPAARRATATALSADAGVRRAPAVSPPDGPGWTASDDRAPPVAPAAASERVPASRRFHRAQLEELAGGRIAAVFGPRFAFVDGLRHPARLPAPPLLLVDRVLDLEGEPLSLGRGVVVTETDVPADAWYAHDGYVVPGILSESSQGNLLLISWLGIDLHTRGERVFRLLGCELTFDGPLPRAGETIRHRITVYGHARSGDVHLYFFEDDCTVGDRPAFRMREGRAGFFSAAELAEAGGVLWDPRTAEHRTDGPLDPPAVDAGRRSFDRQAVDAFVAGRLADCFGPAFARARSHLRPPRTPGGRLRFLERVTAFDPRGGPWGRGYLRAETDVRGDEWFFACHFKDDPVMPGSLMAEGALQAMAFYLSAMGFSLRRDGWRFEPVPGEPVRMVLRGQVVPTSRRMVFEVFVEEVSAGPLPTLRADVLITVDGLKVFHGRRMGVRLVPDWPLTTQRHLLAGHRETREVATLGGVPQGYPAILAAAWGPATAAFGEPYRAFEHWRRLPRLPGPPYLFVSRVRRLEVQPGGPAVGAGMETEYDIPADAWYFAAGGQGRMPCCVLLEAALQPCGLLMSHLGVPLTSAEDLAFRNLDGKGIVHREVGPDAGTLTARVTLTDLSRFGDTVVERFHVECLAGGAPVLTVDAVCGHFTDAALASGAPLQPSEAELEAYQAPPNVDLDLRHRTPGSPAVARDPLWMLDRVTGWWPTAGRAGRGRIRGEKRVDAGEWFFKAHFFQDPVQPASLGIEAMLQLLRLHMLQTGMAAGLDRPRFEAVEVGSELSWKCRGQVLPENRQVVVTLELTAAGRDERGPYARADGTLWVDGKLIWRASGLGMRLVAEGAAAPALDVRPVRAGWRRMVGREEGFAAEDVLPALVERFVHRVHLQDPAAWEALGHRPRVYLANHQVGIESVLFAYCAGFLARSPVASVAKAEHRDSWLGRFVGHLLACPGVTAPPALLFFDRANPGAMLGLVREMRELVQQGCSVLAHVEGTRSRRAGEPVTRVSANLIEFALAAGTAVVPVRFCGGLPEEPVDARLEFPVGFGRQDYCLGRPLLPEELGALPLAVRRERVLEAINGLGPDTPHPGDPTFAAAVEAWSAQTGARWEDAVVWTALRTFSDPGAAARRLLEGADRGRLTLPDEPEGRWLAALARRLYGPRGPRVEVGGGA